jgi:hypothetical protein
VFGVVKAGGDQRLIGLALGGAVDLPMNAIAGLVEGKKRGLMQQAF